VQSSSMNLIASRSSHGAVTPVSYPPGRQITRN
jgi:hypothetical protein